MPAMVVLVSVVNTSAIYMYHFNNAMQFFLLNIDSLSNAIEVV